MWDEKLVVMYLLYATKKMGKNVETNFTENDPGN